MEHVSFIDSLRRWHALQHALAALLAACVMITAPGCRSTQFPAEPEEHRLWQEVQASPHPYYYYLRTGMRSRVMGILPMSAARDVTDRVREHWPALDALEHPARMLTFFRGQGWDELLERTEASLAAAADEAPVEGVRPHLQAAAIKMGLLEAYHELH